MQTPTPLILPQYVDLQYIKTCTACIAANACAAATFTTAVCKPRGKRLVAQRHTNAQHQQQQEVSEASPSC